MLEQRLGYLAVALILCYTLYNVLTGRHLLHKMKGAGERVAPPLDRNITAKLEHHREELSHIDTVSYARHYITEVILHGSHQFHLKGGSMEGGLADRKDAGRIACYVLSLSGKKCPGPQSPDAAMYFTSSCGGCHGNDGKGLTGTYPDLTREKLLGIEKREAFLRRSIASSQEQP